MSDVLTLRRRNLLMQMSLYSQREIAEGRTGSALAFAELVQIHPSLLSKLRGGSGDSTRDVSDKLARQIEARLGLDTGWLDVEHQDAPPTAAEAAIMQLALSAYQAGDARGRRELRRYLQELAGRQRPSSS